MEQKPKQLTKKELRVLARQKELLEKQQTAAAEESHPELYGISPLVNSERITRIYTEIHDVEKHEGEKVLIRARVHNVSGKGKCCFLLLRQQLDTLQVSLTDNRIGLHIPMCNCSKRND